MGENNVIDISNDSEGSQLSTFTEESKDHIIDYLKTVEINYESISNEVLKAIIIVSLGYLQSYVRTCI